MVVDLSKWLGQEVIWDKTYKTFTFQEECTGRFFQKVFVTKMKIPNGTESGAGFYVPRTWWGLVESL